MTATTAPSTSPLRQDGPAAVPLDELYRALFEHALDGAIIAKPDGTILRANAAACRLFGLPEAEVCRLGGAERVVDDARYRALLGEREWTGAASGELTFRRGDGSEFPVEVSSSVILARDGERYTCLLFRDVTAQQRARQALRESEEKLRLLAQAMPQIVCVLGADGLPEYVNPSWTAYSGLDLEGTRRAGWTGFVHPDDVPAAHENRRRVLKRLAPQDVELRYRGADGSFRWFLSRLAPVVEDGRVVRLVGAAMDIEDRKRGEAALREQLALKDQLAKVAASVPGVVCSFRLRPDGSACMPFSAPATADLYGVPQDELARDMAPVFDRIPPDDRSRVAAEIGASAQTLSPWAASFRYEHPEKGLRWIEGASIPARPTTGPSPHPRVSPPRSGQLYRRTGGESGNGGGYSYVIYV